MIDPVPSKDVSGPPFTVDRYGSFADAVIAHRDWLSREIEELRRENVRWENAHKILIAENERLKRANADLLRRNLVLSTSPEPETAPTAWMRGHRSYSPGEPDDYDVECVYGDDPPDDSGKWIPLYRRPAQSQSSDACPKGGTHEWVYRRGHANSFCDKCGFFPGPSQPPEGGQ